MTDPSLLFVAESRRYLTGEYLPKIRLCLARLDSGQIWWRPNEASNSIGNLLLHLAGNLRQWIVAGVGGAPDVRDRAAEFSSRTVRPAADLLALVGETIAEADAVLARLTGPDLLQPRTIQGRQLTVLEAVYHVVEHFAMHTGQIALLTKHLSGEDLGFYEAAGGLARPRWTSEAR